MNNFIKQAAARVRKPRKTINSQPSEKCFFRARICLDFSAFHYNNQALFRKEENTLDAVAKSLLVMSAFRHEAHILRALVRALLAARAHVLDVFFVPVGWVAGAGGQAAPPPPDTHAAIVVCSLLTPEALDKCARAALVPYDIARVVIEDEGRVNVRQFPVSWAPGDDAPVCVVSFYPFDTDCAIGIVFLGRIDDAHCGITFLLPRAQVQTFVSTVRAYVAATHLVNDAIGSFSTTCVTSTGELRRFPARTCTALCEVLAEFSPAHFASAPAPSVTVCVPFVPKAIVSVIDLPSNTEITCSSHCGVDIVTHIGGARLKTALVIAKDPFAKDVTFSGVFTKRNLVWRGKYTYQITSSTFPCPALKARPGGGRGNFSAGACHKHCAMDAAYTTRTFSHIV